GASSVGFPPGGWVAKPWWPSFSWRPSSRSSAATASRRSAAITRDIWTTSKAGSLGRRGPIVIEIPVNLGPRSYPILVGAGALSMVGAQLAKRGVGRRVVLVSDPTIARLHSDAVLRGLTAAGFDVAQVAVPEGERAKRL